MGLRFVDDEQVVKNQASNNTDKPKVGKLRFVEDELNKPSNKPNQNPVQAVGNMLIQGLIRSIQEGPVSIRGIVGGPGQVFAENTKRALFKDLGLNTFSEGANMNNIPGELLAQATDPMNFAGAMAAKTPNIYASRPGALAKQASRSLAEAEQLTTQILKPTTLELADSIAKGKTLPSIARGTESITKVKNFNELVGSLKNTTKELFQERNGILSEYNVPVGKEMLSSLEEFASSTIKSRRYSTQQLKTIDSVAQRESQFLADNPNMDVVTAQARKEELQNFTRPLLEKRRAGNLSGHESIQLQAYDALRAGYRKAILKALPIDKAKIVDNINSKYEGLLDATDLAAKQAASKLKQSPEGLLGALSHAFGLSPKFTAIRIAIKKASEYIDTKQLQGTTQQIAKLRQEAEILRGLSKAALNLRRNK